MTSLGGSETRSTDPRPPLRRHATDHLLGGVCAGLARTLGLDVVVVRIITAVLALLGGAAVAAYVIAWILLPTDDGKSALSDLKHRSRFGQIAILTLIALAAVSLLNIDWKFGNGLGVALLVVIGVLLWQRYEKEPRHIEVGHAQHISTTAAVPRQHSPLPGVIWSVLALALGLSLLLDLTDTINLGGRRMLAILLAVVGIGLIVSAWIGRARGFIALGIILALLLVPAGIDAPTSVGDRTWAPTTSAAVGPYDLGVGTAILDLRGIDLTEGARRTIDAHVGVGKLVVLLPIDAPGGTISTRVGVGSITIFGSERQSGMGQTQTQSFGDGRSLVLNFSVDIGDLEVRYESGVGYD